MGGSGAGVLMLSIMGESNLEALIPCGCRFALNAETNPPPTQILSSPPLRFHHLSAAVEYQLLLGVRLSCLVPASVGVGSESFVWL